MKKKSGMFRIVLVSAAAAGCAWWVSGSDLFGARKTWIESSESYPEDASPAIASPAAETPAISVSANQEPVRVPVDPGEASGPCAETADKPVEDDVKPPAAPVAETAQDSVALLLQKRFPKADQQAGMDPFIRSALVSYAVKPGDTLEAIGKAFKVPHSLLENINGIEGGKIRAGATIQVVEGPFDCLVLRSKRVLRLYCRGVFVKEYGIAVGKSGKETPLGEYTVSSKMSNPDWTNPDTNQVVTYGDPDNPLGTRWIGLRDGIGIHGTWDADSIGSAASRGCVRMRNEDVEELFEFLVRKESAVLIMDDLPENGEKEKGEGEEGR